MLRLRRPNDAVGYPLRANFSCIILHARDHYSPRAAPPFEQSEC